MPSWTFPPDICAVTAYAADNTGEAARRNATP
jgi:hypothetical protein